MAIQRQDPYADYNFLVSIDGFGDAGEVRAGFCEVSGLGVTIEPIDYRNGNEDISVRKLPGLKKFTNITLKRGLTGDLAVWQWITSAMDGQVERRDGSIILLDEGRNEVMRFKFRRGWPCRWEGPSFDARNSEVALETLEICHEGLELE